MKNMFIVTVKGLHRKLHHGNLMELNESDCYFSFPCFELGTNLYNYS